MHSQKQRALVAVLKEALSKFSWCSTAFTTQSAAALQRLRFESMPSLVAAQVRRGAMPRSGKLIRRG